MKITVAQKDLLKLVGRMQGVVERKSTMPILGSVLLEVELSPSPRLRISATDLYLALSGTIPADVSTPGSIVLPAKELLERVKMMPSGPVEIEADADCNTKLRAKGVSRRYTLRGIAGGDFPPVPMAPSDQDAAHVDIAVSAMQALIACTSFSIANDQTRPHMNSALFEWKGQTMLMVSTDGHRLSKKSLPSTGSAAMTMLLSQRTLHELRRLCDEACEAKKAAGEDAPAAPTLRIYAGPRTAFFRVDGMTFSAKLVDGVFPPYEAVIPPGATRELRAPRAALIDALRAVSLASNAQTGGVRMTLKKGAILVEAEGPEAGDASDEVPVEYGGMPITLGFSGKYLIDALSAMTEDEVDLRLNAELDPIVVRSTADDSFLAVVMPMRI